jgi:hypothetical protein
MIGIPLGLVYANAMEWMIHKHLLHGRGKNKKSFWSFHWHEHHSKSRKHDMLDDQYNTPPFRHWDAHTKEAAALLAGAVVHAPLLPVAPFFTLSVWWSAAHYYRVHKKSHQDPEWAKQHLPWHVDHHMGPDQHKNWCVTYPLTDWVLGTRVKYLGTERHKEDVARELARKRSAANTDVSKAA